MIKTVFWTVICFERLVGFNRKNIVRLFDLTFLLRQAKGLSKCKKTVKMCQKNCFFFGQIILLERLQSIETSRQFTVAVAVYANII